MILLATAACLVSTVLGAKATPHIPKLIRRVRLALGPGVETERDYGLVTKRLAVRATKDAMVVSLADEYSSFTARLNLVEVSRLREICDDVLVWGEVEDSYGQ